MKTRATTLKSLRGARDKLDETLRLSHVYGYESTGISRDENSGGPALLVVLDCRGDSRAIPEEFEGLPVSVRYLDASGFDPEISA
jgi:hypothetical protein